MVVVGVDFVVVITVMMKEEVTVETVEPVTVEKVEVDTEKAVAEVDTEKATAEVDTAEKVEVAIAEKAVVVEDLLVTAGREVTTGMMIGMVEVKVVVVLGVEEVELIDIEIM